MDLAGTAGRALATYLVLLILVRASGKTSLKYGTAFQFVMALVVGDMADGVIIGKVGLPRFLVSVVALFITHWAVEFANYRAKAHGVRNLR
jgi:uncharacterized membrane protein YcaP (DUF421 family)